MRKTILLSLKLSWGIVKIEDRISIGDYDAYDLEITCLDVAAITGTVRLRFLRSDGQQILTAPVTIVGNVIYHTLTTEEIACVSPLKMWLQFSEDNLYTPMMILFTKIETVPNGTPITETNEYPELQKIIDEANDAAGIIQTMKNDTLAARDTAIEAKDDAVIAKNNTLEAKQTVDTNTGIVLESKGTVERLISDAEQYEASVRQAMTDLLAMLGNSVATLDGTGKLTPSQIPALSINDVYSVTTIPQMLALTAERGDTAIMMGVDGDNNPIVINTYILSSDDPTIESHWIKLGISYVAQAGHSATSDDASNSERINGKRLISMTASQYAVAVIDADTYYIVVPD